MDSHLTAVPLFNILVGTLLLLFGRRLFWLFTAGIGFFLAAQLCTEVLKGHPQWVTLAIAIAVGVLGALAAILFQRVLIGIVGFFAGGFLLYNAALGTKFA